MLFLAGEEEETQAGVVALPLGGKLLEQALEVRCALSPQKVESLEGGEGIRKHKTLR